MHVSEQTDDGWSPVAALATAVHSLRAFNRRAENPLAPGNPGWSDPGDAHRALGELIHLAEALPQVFVRITGGLRHQFERGHLLIGYGSTFEGRPETAIAAVATALEQASEAAREMRDSLVAAHGITEFAGETGRRSPG